MTDEEKEISERKTLSKKDLIKYLLDRDDVHMDESVLVSYEGQYKPILKDNFSIININSSNVFVLDVEFS